MIPTDDTQFETYVIDRVESAVDGWTISHDGCCFFVPAKYGIEPHVGDEARFYGRGFGYSVRGLSLNGREVFYSTDEEQTEKHRRDVEEEKRRRRAEFETTGRVKLDAEYAALPPEFKRRLDGLRRRNPDFRWEYEGYEMFACRDAVLIAQTLKTDEAVRDYAAAPYDEQRRRVPDLSEGHSGNTHGFAVWLARLWLARPELVELEHGAMCPLVGCRDYGCAAMEEQPL